MILNPKVENAYAHTHTNTKCFLSIKFIFVSMSFSRCAYFVSFSVLDIFTMRTYDYKNRCKFSALWAIFFSRSLFHVYMKNVHDVWHVHHWNIQFGNCPLEIDYLNVQFENRFYGQTNSCTHTHASIYQVQNAHDASTQWFDVYSSSFSFFLHSFHITTSETSYMYMAFFFIIGREFFFVVDLLFDFIVDPL